MTFLNKVDPEVVCTIPANILLANTYSHSHAQLLEMLGNMVPTLAAKKEELEVSDILPNLHFVGSLR